MRSIEENSSEHICKMIVGNKMDKPDKCVTSEEGQAVADKYKIPYYETSAKDNINIDEAFNAIARDIKDKIESNLIKQ